MASPLDGLDPISLQALDERAALLQRVDVKYVVGRDVLAALIEGLAGDHDVLEIEGRRQFAYDTVYFDTEDLRCFRDHGADVRPRFKARTRRYVDAGECVFEVKVKCEDGSTDKRQTEHESDADVLTPAAEELLADTLRDDGIEPPGELAAVLRTSFDRATLAAREGDARLTVDVGVTLATMDGESVRLREDLALVESKSEDGESRADRVLAELGATPVSLSKYRTGIDALLRRDETGEVEEARGLFL
ncbi:MAG TPA: polyphosphate polymerase domain-containing protein [Solirubrobacteraceae bacterium]|nr:polyphosphate polymerase domain-containing protein [Solirubrobacteraceae bacterium]